ncbi:FxsA family protein, partial [Bacillus sp. WP8]|uniref:FxsA family protein n=1 Tax=Bacillus sp. WP8 TaxID=756828 RepID=UPI001642C236
ALQKVERDLEYGKMGGGGIVDGFCIVIGGVLVVIGGLLWDVIGGLVVIGVRRKGMKVFFERWLRNLCNWNGY